MQDTQLQLIPPSHVIEALDNDGRQELSRGDVGLELLVNRRAYDPPMEEWAMRGCSQLTDVECDKSMLELTCKSAETCKDARALRWSCFCPRWVYIGGSA